jgi:hypothetical protein
MALTNAERQRRFRQRAPLRNEFRYVTRNELLYIIMEIKEEIASLRNDIRNGACNDTLSEVSPKVLPKVLPQTPFPNPSSNPLPTSPNPPPNVSLRETPPPRGCVCDDEFNHWYAGYPHKVGKVAAQASFAKARKLADLKTLVAGVERYIANKPAERPWCNPSTWLNQGRWSDEEAKPNGQITLFVGNLKMPTNPK